MDVGVEAVRLVWDALTTKVTNGVAESKENLLIEEGTEYCDALSRVPNDFISIRKISPYIGCLGIDSTSYTGEKCLCAGSHTKGKHGGCDDT